MAEVDSQEVSIADLVLEGGETSTFACKVGYKDLSPATKIIW